MASVTTLVAVRFGTSTPRDARAIRRASCAAGKPADARCWQQPGRQAQRDEVPGEAPAYKNLKHYENDKTRGNKRRR